MITSDKIDCMVNKHNIHHWLNLRLFKGALLHLIRMMQTYSMNHVILSYQYKWTFGPNLVNNASDKWKELRLWNINGYLQATNHPVLGSLYRRGDVWVPGPLYQRWIDISIKITQHTNMTSAANRSIGEVVQSRRRPLLGPSPGWKRLLPLSHLRHY